MLRDGVWYFHKLVRGRREFMGRKTPFSLETRDLVVATAKRDSLLKSGSGAEVDRVLGRSSLAVATLQDIVDAYMAADHPREKTRHKVVQCFKLVIKRSGESRPLDQLTTADLTTATVGDYQDQVVRAVRAAGHRDMSERMLQAKYTANRTLGQARSIFANEKPFRKLHFERPEGFLGADMFVSKRDLSFQPMEAAEVALFVGEAKAIRDTLPGVYATWLLMRWLGLRNEEVEHCKPAEWVIKTPRGWVLRVTNRPYFQVKGVGSIRDLPLVEWLRDEILDLVGAGIEGDRVRAGREWLIPGESITERYDVTHRDINTWLAGVYKAAIEDQRLPVGAVVRTAYDWRKQAGSELYAKTKDILEVSQWLGHQSVHTTTKWYVNLIGGLPSLA